MGEPSRAATALGPGTILVRARDLVLEVGDAEDLRILRGGEPLETRPLALLVLHAFAYPRTVKDALDSVAAAGTQEWIDLSSTVFGLARAGVLVSPAEREGGTEGYARPPIHVAMLDDQARTTGFLDALRALVKKDDIVLDIGTGSGILATTAALAGAARVHAVEASAIADAAEQVFAVNGVADRVRLVRGRSTHVSLDERCTLLVTEMIGNDPLDEHLLEVVADAKDRLLTPDARLIPSAIELFAVPVDVPRRTLERRVFTAERIAAWKATYGVDLSPLRAVRSPRSDRLSVRTEDILEWPRVAAPVSIVDIDLRAPFELVHRSRRSFVLDCDVERLGVLLAFRTTLAPGIVLSTLPSEVAVDNHWRYQLYPSLDQPAFSRGASVTLDYTYERGSTTIALTPV